MALLLLDLSEEWALALKANALTRSAEQRMADQQAAFVTLDVQISLDASDAILTLSDDGDGAVVYARNQPSDAIRNVRLNLAQTERRGSRLAVPLSAVKSIEQRSADHVRVCGSVLPARDGSEAIPVADAGHLLFNVNNVRRQEDVYVIVQPDSGRRMALRVSGIEGTRRAALHAVPGGLQATRLRGFIQSERRVVGVLDLAELSRLQSSACLG